MLMDDVLFLFFFPFFLPSFHLNVTFKTECQIADGREVGEHKSARDGTKRRSRLTFSKSQINACVLFFISLFILLPANASFPVPFMHSQLRDDFASLPLIHGF